MASGVPIEELVRGLRRQRIGAEMITPSPFASKSPSFWTTALSVLASGWVASFFVGLTTALGSSAPGLGASLVYSTLASACMGGVALRFFLPLLTGVEIGYPWAVAAIGLGGLASASVATAVQTAALRHAPAAAPVIWSSPLVLLVTTGISLVVSYWVIRASGHTDAKAASRERRSASRGATTPGDIATLTNPPSSDDTKNASRSNSRASSILWVPAIFLATLAALAFFQPWHSLSLGNGPSLPSLPSATIPTPQTTATTGPKMSAARLASLLQAGTLRWNCTPDPSGTWDYLCTQPQLREVKGYDVSSSQITRFDVLIYAGRSLTP